MVIGGQIHLHALGAHTPSAHLVDISRFVYFLLKPYGGPREKCDSLGSCGNLVRTYEVRAFSAMKGPGLRVVIARFAGAICPVPPPSFQLGAVPILPACLRLLTERWPRLSTAGTQRLRSEEHCTPAEPCQQRRTGRRDWAGD